MGKAVQLAAQDIKNQLKQIVIDDFGVPPEQIGFSQGKIRLPESQLDYKEVMQKRERKNRRDNVSSEDARPDRYQSIFS